MQIDSKFFVAEDQNSLKQLLSFLSLDIQFDGQRYTFKDDKQFTKFLKFRSTFDALKDIFPNFDMKIKPKFSSNNQIQNSSFNKEKDEFLQKNQSTQMNSDQSLTNPKVEQSHQKSYDTPTDQGENYSQQEQIQQKIQQEDPQAPQQNFENLDQELESSIITEVENSENNSIHEFSFKSEIMSQILDYSINIFDDKINLKYNDQTFIIQLKNNQILYIIEQVYLEKWNILIKQLNLNKQSMNCYKLQQPTDYFYINQEIQSFIDSIQQVEIQFCFYSCYTMKEQQSMMNKFLQSHQIQVAQIGDDFYLVSRQQSQQFLQEILSKIYQNYRGFMFNFSSGKPYSNSISSNPILEKSRYLFYKKYLTLDVQQYSFNQYFNENFFFIEMNFAKIQDNRELVEKYIKEYVGGFLKNLFLLQFSIQTTQEIGLKVEKAFQNCIEQLKLKILFYKNNEDLILFGINEDIQILLTNLQAQELKFKKIDVEIDKQNYLFKLKGAQQKIDIKSILDLLKELGFEQKENKKLGFSTSLSKNLNFITLINILRFFCSTREQNNNRIALQTFHKKFRKAIDEKDLKKEIVFLGQINSNNNEQVQQQQQVITLNIRSEILQFPISQTIILNPVFLDEIIQENLYQEFLEKLDINNSKIQFQKISQGKYQLQCINNQVVTQFKQYFDKFQFVQLKLDKTSLSCFELSHYLKKELQKRCIFWKIMEQEQLYLITRNNESLKYAQDFKYYKGKIIYMLSLNATNLNEKIEYHQLVLARTNYFKYKIQDFLKQNLTQIKEIEFREEQEISSFCIIHSNFTNQEQVLNKCIEQIQSLIGSKIFLELKINSEIGKRILEKIIEISDLYVSQKQQYSDYYITMLGNVKNFQKIDQLFQKIYLPNEQVTNIQISFYIEQFIPFKNIIQKTQDRDKFKKNLESKGFSVDHTNIKWIIEIKPQLQKFMIFSNLIEWMNQDTMQNIKNNYLLNLEMMEQSAIKINAQQNSFQEIEFSLLSFLENKPNNKVDNKKIQIIQQIGNLDNSGFQDKQQLLQDQSERISNSEISDQDSHLNLFQIGNQTYDVLAEFTNSIKKSQLPPNSQIAQILKELYPNQNILVFQPYVDQNYKEQFLRLTSDFVDLYVLQKSDKVYKGVFSNKMFFTQNAKSAIEKFMQHSNLILILFKANRLCKYSQHSDKEKICLIEDNQVLPYLFLKRK